MTEIQNIDVLQTCPQLNHTKLENDVVKAWSNANDYFEFQVHYVKKEKEI